MFSRTVILLRNNYRSYVPTVKTYRVITIITRRVFAVITAAGFWIFVLPPNSFGFPRYVYTPDNVTISRNTFFFKKSYFRVYNVTGMAGEYSIIIYATGIRVQSRFEFNARTVFRVSRISPWLNARRRVHLAQTTCSWFSARIFFKSRLFFFFIVNIL